MRNGVKAFFEQLEKSNEKGFLNRSINNVKQVQKGYPKGGFAEIICNAKIKEFEAKIAELEKESG